MMKCLLQFVVLLGLVCSLISAQEVALGTPIRARALLASDTCDGIYAVRCTDCSHLQVCANIEISKKTCSSININTPYCVDNGCVEEPPKDEPSCALPFICTGSGLYPDLTDCTRYYLCAKSGDPNALLHQCPPQFVYDSRTEVCKRRRTPADCQTIDCRRLQGQFTVFKNDPSILAYCPDGAFSPIQYRCQDSIFGHYDPHTLQCKFNCPAEGRFPDRLDCHKFFECYRNGSTFTNIHQNCGTAFAYDHEAKRCVLDTNNCQPDVKPEPPAGGAGGENGGEGSGNGGGENGGNGNSGNGSGGNGNGGNGSGGNGEPGAGDD